MSVNINGTVYRIGRDSIYSDHIPVAGTDIAMGYSNGHWPSYKDLRTRFPNIAIASIDVNGSDITADILDVENGDATPAGAVTWVKSKKAHDGAGKYPPILYANRSTLTPLFNALNAAGFQVKRDFRLGIATLDGTKSVKDMTGVTYVQYLENVAANFDESVIWDQEWKKSAVPVPPPVVTQHGVLVAVPSGATHAVSSTDGVHWQ